MLDILDFDTNHKYTKIINKTKLKIDFNEMLLTNNSESIFETRFKPIISELTYLNKIKLYLRKIIPSKLISKYRNICNKLE